MNTTKFKMYHGERYSQDVNKFAMHSQHNNKLSAPMLGPPLTNKKYPNPSEK